MESKNDTTVAAVDVLMKTETSVDDVQMKNASNQDDGKAVDNVVSNHGKGSTYYAGNGLAQMATKGNLREVVTTCERSWVKALSCGFSFRSKKGVVFIP
nr:hypothetical protein [Tanacetum cinerariifolium]